MTFTGTLPSWLRHSGPLPYAPPLARTRHLRVAAEAGRVLLQLVALVADAILIGGWGTWVRRQGLPSHDIDLIVDRASKEAVLAIADEHSQSPTSGDPSGVQSSTADVAKTGS